MAVYSPESPCQISAVRPLTSARTTPWAYKVLGFSCSFLINFTTFNWPSHRFLFHWSTSSLPPLAAILLVFMTSCPLGKPFSPAKQVVMVGEWTAWCLTGRWRPLSLADALPVFQHYTFLKCFMPLDPQNGCLWQSCTSLYLSFAEKNHKSLHTAITGSPFLYLCFIQLYFLPISSIYWFTFNWSIKNWKYFSLLQLCIFNQLIF